MPKNKKFTEEEILALLTKYNISQERYTTEKAQLEALGYSQEQAQGIILCRFSIKSVQALLKLHSALISKRYPDVNGKLQAWSHVHLAGIAKCSGAAQTLELLAKKTGEYIALGYDITAIQKMATNGGGAKALATVLKHTQDLKQLGFDSAAIQKMAANYGGAQALAAVLKHTHDLMTLGFDIAAIQKMAANGGGAQALATVLKHTQDLKPLGFDIDAIQKMAANGGGAQALAAVLKHTQDLKPLGFDIDAIQKMAANNGGARALAAVLKHTHDLMTLGFDIAAIQKMAAHIGGAQALAAVLKHTQDLKQLGFDIDAIQKMAAHNGGAQALAAVLKHTHDLMTLGFDIDAIQKMAAQGGSAQLIYEVVTYEALLSQELSMKNLCAYFKTMVKRQCYHHCFERVLGHFCVYEFLSEPGGSEFRSEQILSLFSMVLQKCSTRYAEKVLNMSFVRSFLKADFSQELPLSLSFKEDAYWQLFLLNKHYIRRLDLSGGVNLLVYHFPDAPLMALLLQHYLNQCKKQGHFDFLSSFGEQESFNVHVHSNYLVVDNLSGLVECLNLDDRVLLEAPPLSAEQLQELSPLLHRLSEQLPALENSEEDTSLDEILASINDWFEIPVAEAQEQEHSVSEFQAQECTIETEDSFSQRHNPYLFWSPPHETSTARPKRPINEVDFPSNDLGAGNKRERLVSQDESPGF